MPSPEGYTPDRLQPQELPLTVEQLQQKSLEIVAKAANLSNRYLEKLGMDQVQERLASMGYSKVDVQPRGKIYDDIRFRGVVSQTMALVGWALQRTPLEGPNDTPERTPHKLAEVMRPIDRAFALAAATIGVDQEEALQGLLGGRTSVQLSPEERAAGLLELREILRIKDPTIPDAQVAQRLLLLRQNLPLHIRKLEDPQFSATDGVLQALSTPSILGEQSSVPKDETSMVKREIRHTDPSQVVVRLPYVFDRSRQRKRTNNLKIEIPRSWGLTVKDVNRTKRALKQQEGKLSPNDALAFASVDLKMRVLPRALANGVVSASEIGEIMPLSDGREVIVGKHIIMDGDKQRVRYSYDIANPLGAARSPEQLQEDEQRARDHIFREMSNRWFVPVDPEKMRATSDAAIARSLLPGTVTPKELSDLNISPTPDGRFVTITEVEKDENGDGIYFYDLSIPKNGPDERTPEQKERDRREAAIRIRAALDARKKPSYAK